MSSNFYRLRFGRNVRLQPQACPAPHFPPCHAPQPSTQSDDPVLPDPRQQPSPEHHQFHRVVRADLLGVPRNRFGLRDGGDRGYLFRAHSGLRDLVRQPGRSPSQEAGDAGFERGVADPLRRLADAAARRAGKRAFASRRFRALAVHPAGDGGRDRGQYPPDRPAHAGHGADPGGPPRPGQWTRRHGDGDRLRGDLGDQRLPGRLGRDAGGADLRARPDHGCAGPPRSAAAGRAGTRIAKPAERRAKWICAARCGWCARCRACSP